jgi:hypothetical protein
MQSRNHSFAIAVSLLIFSLILSACGAPTAQPTLDVNAVYTAAAQTMQAQATPTVAVGGITNVSVRIVPEGASGAPCSGTSTYTVFMDITSNGPTSAAYDVYLTDSSGQIADGSFDGFASPEVKDSLKFTAASTQTVQLRVVGPYGYPDGITVRGKVNGNDFNSVKIACGSAAPQPTLTPTIQPVAAQTCLAAEFISDVTIPDGTVLNPNQAFTKTWELKNAGTCNWDSSIVMVVESGPGMTQNTTYPTMPSGNTVVPGATVDVSIGMTAPPQAGSYRTYWRLQDGSGNFLPVFYNGKDITHFYVDIKVGGSTGGGAVSSAAASYSWDQASGTVCTDDAAYLVTVNITANGAATVNYRFDLTDSSGQVTNGVFAQNGSPEMKDSITFNAAGTQQVIFQVAGPYAYPKDLVVRVYLNDSISTSAAVACQ